MRVEILQQMIPLTQKRSLRLAVLKQIAVRKPFFSRSNELRYRSNGSSYPFKKIKIRSNGSSYPFKKISIRSNGSSSPFKKISICSSSLSYPFKKICQPFEQFELSIQKNCQPFERLELSVLNNLSAVRMAQRAIGGKKRFISLSCEWFEPSC